MSAATGICSRELREAGRDQYNPGAVRGEGAGHFTLERIRPRF